LFDEELDTIERQ